MGGFAWQQVSVSLAVSIVHTRPSPPTFPLPSLPSSPSSHPLLLPTYSHPLPIPSSYRLSGMLALTHVLSFCSPRHRSNMQGEQGAPRRVDPASWPMPRVRTRRKQLNAPRASSQTILAIGVCPALVVMFAYGTCMFKVMLLNLSLERHSGNASVQRRTPHGRAS